MDLFKLAAPDEFELAMGGDWTWHWRGGYSGKHFDLDMDAQVFDFKRNSPDSSGCRRIPVQQLSEPVQEQRIIWIRLDFKGRDLTGQGNWPAETLPATTTSQ
jgi:hypothetical protein